MDGNSKMHGEKTEARGTTSRFNDDSRSPELRDWLWAGAGVSIAVIVLWRNRENYLWLWPGGLLLICAGLLIAAFLNRYPGQEDTEQEDTENGQVETVVRHPGKTD